MPRLKYPDFRIEDEAQKVNEVQRLEKEVERARRALTRLDSDLARQITARYQVVLDSLNANLDALMTRIEAAQRGEFLHMPEHWLMQEDRYLGMIRDLQEQMLDFMDAATADIEGAKRDAIRWAEDAVPNQAVAGMVTPDPALPPVKEQEAIVRGSFNKMNPRWVELAVARTKAGAPLRDLIAAAAGDVEEEVTNALMTGMAKGEDMAKVAKAISNISNLPLNRMLTIARTETMGVARQASHEQFRMSSVVNAWMWSAELDERTCVICWGEDGVQYPDDQTMDSHPNCRCVMIPITKSWDELGFTGLPAFPAWVPKYETGMVKFDRLTDEQKIGVLGRTRFVAYQANKNLLASMSRTTKHPVWGNGKRQATLKELGLKKLPPEKPRDPILKAELTNIRPLKDIGPSGISETYVATLKGTSQRVQVKLRLTDYKGVRGPKVDEFHGIEHAVGAERIARKLGLRTPRAVVREAETLGREARSALGLSAGDQVGLQEWLEGIKLEDAVPFPVPKATAERFNVFDYVIGNTDRHPGQWGYWEKQHIPMDHDLVFPTTTHRIGGNAFEWVTRAGEPMDGSTISDDVLQALKDIFLNEAQWRRDLTADGLSGKEIDYMFKRLSKLVQGGKHISAAHHVVQSGFFGFPTIPYA